MLIFQKFKHKMKYMILIRPYSFLVTSNNNNNKSNAVQNLRVVFFGSDRFSIRILRALKQLVDEKKIAEISVVTSIKSSTTSSSSSSAENQVYDMCRKENINFKLWSNISSNQEYLKLFKRFDIGVVASFGHLIPSNLINLFPQYIVYFFLIVI